MNKVKYCIDNYVPVKSIIIRNLITQNGWTNIVSEKLRKSIMPGNVFTHSHSYRDYEEYCKLRNSASKAVTYPKKKHQKGIAESVKNLPSHFGAM